jgi:hypothetical protein
LPARVSWPRSLGRTASGPSAGPRRRAKSFLDDAGCLAWLAAHHGGR